ncbi:MAG TPA: hypothetical protein EYM84_02555, partial [Flavobacteriales bacterium]|nr:hypothetical protein [Flavobacteriales bacterium]
MGFLSDVTDRNSNNVMGFNIMLKRAKTSFLSQSFKIMPILIVMIFAFFWANAQNQKSEKALIKNAEGLFKNEMYIDAYPLYSQLLSIYPDNIKYNYKFSVCMLFADEEKEKAIMYLLKVNAKSNANKKALYYLGYAYHLNYEFNKAIIVYQKYINVASKKDSESLGVQRKIEMCKNGLTLLQGKTKIGVVGKIRTKETEYFRSYDMQLLTGKILVKPDDFKTITDREKNEQSLVYLGKNAKKLFYSSYGNEGTNKDIFMVKKRPDGFWGAASKLPPIINSQYDEDFPVMHPKKNVLYFCSKGHNSMGGYDVFKTTYNAKKDYWTPPVNLDFAINSTDDDILYVPTDDELTAYFSSKRSSVQGQISVYKIKLKEIPGVYIEEPEDEDIEAGEPLALDEIHMEAELNVNAADDNLILSTAEEANYQPSDAIQTETFIDLSDEEMVDVAFEYAQNLKDQEIKLKKEAEASFMLAREKNDQVSVKSNEAEAILTRIDNIYDEDQKKTAVKKADNLKAESEKLAKEAGIAFEIAKELAAEADERNKQAEKAKNNANKIESAVKTNQTEESISLLIEQKALAKSTELGSIGVDKMASEKEAEAKVLEAEAADAYEKIQFMENEISEIGDEIIRLEKEASITEDAILMEEILFQKQDLEFEKKNTEQELQATYSQAETLDNEAKVKRDETNLLKGVSNEIVEAADNVETASVDVRESSSTNEVEENLNSTLEQNEESSLVSLVSEKETEVKEESTEPLVSIIEENNEESDESDMDESEESYSAESDESYSDETEESYSDETDESYSDETDESDTDEYEESDTDEYEESDTDEYEESDTDEYEESYSAESKESDTDESEKSDSDEYEESDTDEYEESYSAESKESDTDESEKSDSDEYEESDTDEYEESDTDEYEESYSAESKESDTDESEKSYSDKADESYSDKADESYSDETDESESEESSELSAEETQDAEYTTEINVGEELAAVEDLEAEAVNYETEASTIRENAESNNDPDSKEKAINEAEELEIAAAKKKTEASKNKATVYSYTFTQNVSQYADITTANKYLNNEDIATMEQAMKEADILYQQAQEIRQNASTISYPVEEANELARADEKEEEAIATQEKAIHQMQYKENRGEILQLSSQTDGLNKRQLGQIEKQNTEFAEIFENAENLRKDIAYIEGKQEREAARRKSNLLEEQAIEKQITSINLYEFYKY